MSTQPKDHMSKSKALETALNNKLLGSHRHLKKGIFSPTPCTKFFPLISVLVALTFRSLYPEYRLLFMHVVLRMVVTVGNIEIIEPNKSWLRDAA